MKITIDIGPYHLYVDLTLEGIEYAKKWLNDIGLHLLNRREDDGD